MISRIQRNTRKSGFTIVELVIVIAVIAILAAVLIPTFANLIAQANLSADQVAVKTINKYLKTDEELNGKPKTLDDVLIVLGRSNLDADQYKALTEGYDIVWDSRINQCLLVDATVKPNLAVYPDEYAGKAVNTIISGIDPNSQEAFVGWCTLTGKTAPDDSWRTNDLQASLSTSIETIKNDASFSTQTQGMTESQKNAYAEAQAFKTSENNYGTYTSTVEKTDLGTYVNYVKVASSAQLTSLVEQLKESKEKGAEYKIYIKGTVDFAGAQWAPFDEFAGEFNGGIYNAAGTLTSSSTVQNFKMTSDSAVTKVYEASTLKNGYYFYGMFSTFTGDYFGNLYVESATCATPGYAMATTLLLNSHITSTILGGAVNFPTKNDDGTFTGKLMIIENLGVGGGNVVGYNRCAGVIGFLGGHKPSNGFDPFNMGAIWVRNCINRANVSTENHHGSSYGTAGGVIGQGYMTNTQWIDSRDHSKGEYLSYTYSRQTTVNESAHVLIEDCVNYGNVTGFHAGGIMSSSNSCSGCYVFKNCANYGDVTGTCSSYSTTAKEIIAAGIAAEDSNAKFINCTNTGDIKVVTDNRPDADKETTAKAGAITVSASKAKEAEKKFDNCKNTGSVTNAINADNVFTGSSTGTGVISGTGYNGVYIESYTGGLDFSKTYGKTIADFNTAFGTNINETKADAVVSNVK